MGASSCHNPLGKEALLLQPLPIWGGKTGESQDWGAKVRGKGAFRSHGLSGAGSWFAASELNSAPAALMREDERYPTPELTAFSENRRASSYSVSAFKRTSPSPFPSQTVAL